MDLRTCGVWWYLTEKGCLFLISCVEFGGHLTKKGCLFGTPHVWSLVVILLRRTVCLDLHTCGVWWVSY